MLQKPKRKVVLISQRSVPFVGLIIMISQRLVTFVVMGVLISQSFVPFGGMSVLLLQSFVLFGGMPVLLLQSFVAFSGLAVLLCQWLVAFEAKRAFKVICRLLFHNYIVLDRSTLFKTVVLVSSKSHLRGSLCYNISKRLYYCTIENFVM